MSTALGLGLGVGLTLDVVADTCRARLAGDPALAQIGYVNLGLRHDDLIPDGVPALLNECGWPVVVHAIDVNLSTALDEDEVLSLARLGDALDARWFEEDLGVWVWGRMSLGLHHLPPLLTQHSVEVSAANIARCRYLLGRPLHIENPPVHYAEGDLDMWEFLAAVADAAECGIVLDSGHLIGYHLNTDTPIELRTRALRPGLPSASCTSPASSSSTSGKARLGSTSTPRRCLQVSSRGWSRRCGTPSRAWPSAWSRTARPTPLSPPASTGWPGSSTRRR